MALLGRFYFPGLPPALVRHANYSLGHGVASPGIITVEVPAGTAYPSISPGTAVFSFGGTEIQIPNCKFDAGGSRMSGERIWTFAIKDGRWAFEFGEISGRYNIRKPDNTIQKYTEKTPQELATLLLRAMRVTRYDVSAMENTRRPEVSWSYDNPAQALENLADECGCRVAWQVDGSVQIVAAGFGAELPDYPSSTVDFNFDTASLPKAIKVVGAPTLFQARWVLEPVGLDIDGKWKHIDDLSYKPSGGWGAVDPETLSEIRNDSTITQPIWDLAIRTVYRCYRIKRLCAGRTKDFSFIQGPPTAKLPGIDPQDDPYDMNKLNSPDATPGDPDYYKHCLPLGSGLIELQYNGDGEGGERKPKAPIIRGDFWDPEFINADVKATKYKGQFSIDAQHGIVQFGGPMYCNVDPATGSAASGYVPANITLEIAFNVKDKNWADVRPYWLFPLSSDGPGNKIIEANETRYTVEMKYTRDNLQDGQKDNRETDNLDQDAADLANVYLKSLNTLTGGDKTYPGMYNQKTDGAICQISWSVGNGFTTTRMSRNTEHDSDIIPNRAERRRRARAEEASRYGQKFAKEIFDREWKEAESGRAT